MPIDRKLFASQAAVLREVGGPLTIEPIDIGPLQGGDVLVKIKATSLCHTDLEVIDGALRYPLPIVLGHEAAGDIVEVGSGVARTRIGEPVVLSWNPHCGHCADCEAGMPILCEDYLAKGPSGVQLDGTTRLHQAGAPLSTMFFTGAFAEYAVVSEHCAVAVPAAMPADRACLLGCAVMTGVGAAIRVAAVAPGETVVVLGCGAVGLSAVQGARLAGAEHIIAVDPMAEKRVLAGRLGATHGFDAAEALDAIRALTHGRGADVVIECAGHPDAFELSAEACRRGGRVVWLGKLDPDRRVGFRWGSLMGEKRFIRSSYGAARPRKDFPWLARAWLDGRLKLDELVTARLALADINQGFEALRHGRSIRSVICLG